MLDSFWGRWPAAAGSLLVLSAVLAGLLSGCGGKAEPEAAEAKKFRPVDDSEPAVAAAEPTNAAATQKFGSPSEFAAAARPAPPSGAAEKSSDAASPREPAPAGGEAPQVSAELRPVLEQLNRLARQQPKGNSEREQLEDTIRIQTQRLTLAKKALGMKPSVELKRELVMAINQIYQVFVDAGIPSAMAQLTDFSKTISTDPDPVVAQMGRHAQFAANFSRIASRPLDDGKEIVAEAKKLLDPERGNVNQETLQLLVGVANHLMEAGFASDASALFELMADTLAADSKLAEEAPRFAMEAKVRRLDMNTLLANVARGKPDSEAKIAEAARALLTENPPTADLLNHVLTIAHNLESFGHYELAQKCFEQISAAYRDVEAPELADAKLAASKAAQRVGLIGQPFTVEGVTMDGAPFDWSAYAGKVVLVDFWATWCRPCLEEMPNIRQNFEDFHAKGFEVVGVSLNTVASDLQQFLSIQTLPWTTVTSQVVLDGQVDRNDWTKLPMATKSGVASIPFVVLVGKDGKVDSIHVRGPKLRSRLMELLGDPITTEVPADPTVPSAKAKVDAGKQSNAAGSRSGATPAGLLMASALFAAEEPTTEEEAANPYLAKPGLTASQLVAYVQKMLDRPQAIQTRAGFADAIVEACDRVLAAREPATDSEQLVAIESKFAVLHREACDGKEAADKQLMEFVEQVQGDSRKQVASEVVFFKLERRVLDAKELPVEEIPALLKDVQAYVAKEKLTGKHLRLASSTTAAINRLESGDEREAHFATFGQLFTQSSDKELVRYGKKLAKKPKAEEAAANR